MSDREADDIFLRQLLGLIQLGVFGIAVMLLIAVYAYSQQESICGKNEVRAESGSGDSERPPEDTAGGDAAHAYGWRDDSDVRGLRPH